ncbi:hypothetical protein GGS26DRAFT_559216 [Hypomontagnella submonticulosa]|nr:hypothetical protein GGS26DRAFT_559216 [Hypomontagnella submonticulosa]
MGWLFVLLDLGSAHCFVFYTYFGGFWGEGHPWVLLRRRLECITLWNGTYHKLRGLSTVRSVWYWLFCVIFDITTVLNTSSF